MPEVVKIKTVEVVATWITTDLSNCVLCFLVGHKHCLHCLAHRSPQPFNRFLACWDAPPQHFLLYSVACPPANSRRVPPEAWRHSMRRGLVAACVTALHLVFFASVSVDRKSSVGVSGGRRHPNEGGLRSPLFGKVVWIESLEPELRLTKKQ